MIFYLFISFLCTLVGMKYFIFLLKHTSFLKRGESINTIKKSCIKELHKDKQNTLTMGGVVMNLSLLIMSIVYYFIYQSFPWVNLLIILYGILGFVDDYIKIKRPCDGVKPRQKLIALTLISTLIIIVLVATSVANPVLIIPFIDQVFKVNTIFYSAFMIIILVASTNSANITDGLDGLILGIASIALSFIIISAWQLRRIDVLYSAVVILGTCLGALVYNRHPAKIFIGDTGSLFLGGALVIFLIQLNMPLWVVILLGVCVWEMLTVIIQLSSIKLRGKRVFKIAPFHHHLEKCGWKETKIVYIFWLITGVLCLVGYVGLEVTLL